MVDGVIAVERGKYYCPKCSRHNWVWYISTASWWYCANCEIGFKVEEMYFPIQEYEQAMKDIGVIVDE